MALSDQDLARYRDWLYIIDPFCDGLLTPLGYDVSPGYVLLLTKGPQQGETGGQVDKDQKGVDSEGNRVLLRAETTEEEGTFVIPAKRGVILVTKEQVYLTGKLLATLHGRSRITQEGVVVNPVTVDPNWCGPLTLYFYNTSDRDVEIDASKGIATLIFHTLETRTQRPPDSWGAIEVIDASGLTQTQKNALKDYVNDLDDIRKRTNDLDRKSNSAWERVKWHVRRFVRQHRALCIVALVLVSISVSLVCLSYLPEIPEPASETLQTAGALVSIATAIGVLLSLLFGSKKRSRREGTAD